MKKFGVWILKAIAGGVIALLAHRRKGDLAAPAEKRIYKNYPYHLTKAVTNIHDEPPV